MGYNIAKNLIRHVDQLNITSRNSRKTLKFISNFKKNKKLHIYDSLKDLAHNSNIIISCVGNDRDLKEIFLAKNGILNHINKNTVIINHTTASAEIINLYTKKFYPENVFYDAPVSGGEIGAIKGTLSIMVGGNKK